jgi:HK97 gp10 family phage protein
VAKLRNFRSGVLLAAVSQDKAIRKTLQVIATRVRDDARSLAPRRTGALRRSIKVFNYYDPVTRTVEYRVGWDRSIAFYGWMVEAGTEHSQPQPHLRPAAIKNGGRPPLSGGI